MIIPRPAAAVSIAVLGPADAKLFLRSTGNPEEIPPDCLKGKAYAPVGPPTRTRFTQYAQARVSEKTIRLANGAVLGF
jgi:hypothetical protein